MKKILLIEDNEDIREITAELLSLSNYNVITACNGREGVEKALSLSPDLVLCDIMMPELDGYGVFHVLQHNPATQRTPFIFLTAKTDHQDIRKGMSLGADDYIIKPFDPTDLLNTIENRLKKSEMFHKGAVEGLDGMNKLIVAAGGEKLLEQFVEGRHVDHYKKKQRIFSEGNHPVRLYYVQKGKVKVYKNNEDGKQRGWKGADSEDRQ
jgi:DNA-binding response OmpR family regulator